MQAHTALIGGDQRGLPVDDAAHVAGQVVAQGFGITDQARRATAQVTHPWRAQFDFGESGGQLAGGLIEQFAVRRHAHGQALDRTGTEAASAFGDRRHGGITASDHQLRLGIDIGQVHRAIGFNQQTLDAVQVETKDGGHAIAAGVGALHQLAAQGDQAHGIGEVQRTGHHGGGIGADGQAGDVVGAVPAFDQQTCGSHAGDQQAELHGAGALQGFGRIQQAHVFVQRRTGLLQASLHQRRIRQCLEHAGLLRALAGEGPQRAHAATRCRCQGSLTSSGPFWVFSNTLGVSPAHSRSATAPCGVSSCRSMRPGAASSLAHSARALSRDNG